MGVKRGLKQVWIEVGEDITEWMQIHDRRNELTAGGTPSILYLPEWTSGYTIRLVYDGPHPKVATCAAILKLLEWYNRRDENQDSESYFLWLENEYRTKHLPFALAENPIQKTARGPKYSVFNKRPIYHRD